MNWEQLQAIIWLRWRLTKNRFGRAGPVNAVIAILMLVLMLAGAVVFALAGFTVGAFALRNEGPQVLLLVLDGVVFAFGVFWLSGLMIEIQRAESIDLPKLLHLPITLQQVFLFNYVASHFTPSIILFLPGLLGLCLGLVLSGGVGMALLIPLVLSLIFLLTAWTYCLRGWLAALMINKRRRQAIIVWMTVGVILLAQLPNVVVNSRIFQKAHRTAKGPAATQSKSEGRMVPDRVLQAHLALPPGWLGYGGMALKQQNSWPALAATAVSCGLGALGLRRAYRATIRFYRGGEGWVRVAPVSKPSTRPRGRLLVERTLPWLQEDVAALTLATLRSLLRAPEIKIAMVMPVMVVAALSSIIFMSKGHSVPPPYLLAFVSTAAAAFGVFPLVPLMSNAFGLDRNGFRALVLLPTQRHYILLAKNLALFPFVGGISLVFLVAVKFLLRVPWEGFLAGLLQAPLAFVLFSLMCNVIAILAPYRLAVGTLQAKKPKPIVFVSVFAMMLVLPLIAAPVLIPPGLGLLFSVQGWLPGLPINLIGSAVMLTGASCLYWALLPLEGRLLQRRERAILREVTEEAE